MDRKGEAELGVWGTESDREVAGREKPTWRQMDRKKILISCGFNSHK